MLIRLLDSDIEDADRVRNPHASFGGWPPAAGPSVSSLIAEPTDPYDPFWTIMGRSWPRPPFGTPGPVRCWPYQIGWPGPRYPNASGRGTRLPPIMPLPAVPHGGEGAASMRPLPFWLEPPNRAATVPQAPVVPGLDALLAMDDDAENASVSAPGSAAGAAPDRGEGGRIVLAQAGGTADWPQMPITPGQDTIPDDIEREFRALARYGRSLGLIEAPGDLEHFLGASGEPRIIHRDHARQFGPILDAQGANEGRQEKAFVVPDRFAPALLSLKDGQTIVFEDNWDKVYGDRDFLRHLVDPSTRDFALAFGNTHLATKGDLAATRVGDEIHIEGAVRHEWDDPYDFHPNRYLGIGGFKARDAETLERYGRAKPFARKSSWPRRVKGTIKIENGALKDPAFEWEDIDQ